MKQHITPLQLQELSLAARKKLLQWIEEHGYIDAEYGYLDGLLSVGQMIELIGDISSHPGWTIHLGPDRDEWVLADNLWGVCKQELEE